MVASSSLGDVAASFGATPSLATVHVVSGNFFRDLGVSAIRGRVLMPEDDRPSTDAIVITFDYWRKQFAADPSIVGKAGYLDGRPFRIVGVIARSFTGTLQAENPADIFAPLASVATLRPGQPYLTNDSWFWLQVLGRLQHGVTLDRVRDELAGSFRSALPQAQDVPQLGAVSGARGYEAERMEAQDGIVIVGVVCALLFVMAALSVSSGLSTWTAHRGSEFSIRRALGSSRLALVRLVVIEGLVYVVMGGALGFIVSNWITELIQALVLPAFTFSVDIGVEAFLFAVVATLIAAAIIATPMVAAVLRSSRVSIQQASGRSTRIPGLRAILVTQAAVATIPLVAAGLMTQTLLNLQRVDSGMAARAVTLFKVRAGQDVKDAAVLAKRLRDALQAQAAVSRVGVSSRQMIGDNLDRVPVKSPAIPESADIVISNRVAGDFFAVMGIPASEGRMFDHRDDDSQDRICVVNEAFKSRYFGGSSAVGHVVNGRRIVGVSRNTIYGRIQSGYPPMMFVPLFQEPVRSLSFQVETTARDLLLESSIRSALQSVDPTAVVHDVTTMPDEMVAATTRERSLAELASTISIATLAMAALTIWGATIAVMHARARETAIRIALGANVTKLAFAIGRTNMILGLSGIVAGLVVASALAQLIRNALFNVQPVDPMNLVFAGAAAALLFSTVCVVALARIRSMSPMQVLRTE